MHTHTGLIACTTHERPQTLCRRDDGDFPWCVSRCQRLFVFPYQSAIWWAAEEGCREGKDQQSGPGVIIVVKPPILTNQQRCGSPTVPGDPASGGYDDVRAMWRRARGFRSVYTVCTYALGALTHSHLHNIFLSRSR